MTDIKITHLANQGRNVFTKQLASSAEELYSSSMGWGYSSILGKVFYLVLGSTLDNLDCHSTAVIQSDCKQTLKSRNAWNRCSNLFWSKYGPYVVSHTLAATGAEDCAALSLPILVGAGNTHSCRYDTVGLQDVYHSGVLLKIQSN